MDSDESELTEPLSHLSSSDEDDSARPGKARSQSISNSKLVVKTEITNDPMDVDSPPPSSPPAREVKIRPKKKVRDRAGEKVRRLERERLAAVAAEEAKMLRLEEKRKKEAAERELSKKRKKVILSSSSASSSEDGNTEDEEPIRAVKRKRSLTSVNPVARPASSSVKQGDAQQKSGGKMENRERNSRSPSPSIRTSERGTSCWV